MIINHLLSFVYLNTDSTKFIGEPLDALELHILLVLHGLSHLSELLIVLGLLDVHAIVRLLQSVRFLLRSLDVVSQLGEVV